MGLRKAFDDEENPYLPKDVLWRQKEQFSDGVGYSWIDGIQDHAEKMVTDEQLAEPKFRFPEKTPKTKEAYLYRDMFSKHFGERNANSIRTVECRTPLHAVLLPPSSGTPLSKTGLMPVADLCKVSTFRPTEKTGFKWNLRARSL